MYSTFKSLIFSVIFSIHRSIISELKLQFLKNISNKNMKRKWIVKITNVSIRTQALVFHFKSCCIKFTLHLTATYLIVIWCLIMMRKINVNICTTLWELDCIRDRKTFISSRLSYQVCWEIDLQFSLEQKFFFSLHNCSIFTVAFFFYQISLIYFSCLKTAAARCFWRRMPQEFLTTWESHFYIIDQLCNAVYHNSFKQTSCNLIGHIWKLCWNFSSVFIEFLNKVNDCDSLDIFDRAFKISDFVIATKNDANSFGRTYVNSHKAK